jgi:hypothetical protein
MLAVSVCCVFAYKMRSIFVSRNDQNSFPSHSETGFKFLLNLSARQISNATSANGLALGDVASKCELSSFGKIEYFRENKLEFS